MTIPQTNKAIYQRIVAAATAIVDQTARYVAPTQSHTALHQIQHLQKALNGELDLSYSNTLLEDLVRDGIPGSVAQKLSTALDQAARTLALKITSSFRDSWSKVLEVPRHHSMIPLNQLQEQIVKSHEALYRRRLSSWIQDVRAAAKSRVAASSLEKIDDSDVHEPSPPTRYEVRSSFNHYYLPVLEAFFAENQFPSRADKNFLAKKSGMTYRQIHVWFQNRRSRSKKTSASPKSRDSSSPSPRPYSGPAVDSASDFDRTRTDMGEDTDVDEDYEDAPKTMTSISRSSSCTTLVEEPIETHPFDRPLPSYAYPTTYPPKCDVDPFPCRAGRFTCATIEWTRKPLAVGPNHSAVDIPALEASFAKLRLSEVQSPRSFLPPSRWGLHEPAEKTGCDVMEPFTVRPLRAPLFAFIPVRPRPVIKIPSGSAAAKTPARKTAFSRAGSADPPVAFPVRKATKKISGPERRVPLSSPVQRKGASPPPTPPTSQADAAPSTSTRSASSSSHECSTTSFRSSSNSSSSSSSAASPVTPVNPLPQTQDFDPFNFTYNSAIPLKDSLAFDYSSSNEPASFSNSNTSSFFAPSHEQFTAPFYLDLFGSPSL